MKSHSLMLAISVSILLYGAVAASAQNPAASMMHQPSQEQLQSAEDDDEPGMGGGKGMMGCGMMGHGMMRHDMMGHGMMRRGGMLGPPFAMRIIFALMDSDGDGTVSLQEFQTAHERIFKAMDANKDGVLTMEEMRAFMRGTSKSPSQHEDNDHKDH